MDIILERTFNHRITEIDTADSQEYRIVVACDVVANLFGHSELVFDTVYHFVAQNTTGYERTASELLYNVDSNGYGMVTVFRVPLAQEMDFRQNVGRMFQAMVERDSKHVATKVPPLHYQEGGSVSVYMKRYGDELWAFAIDDARNYCDFADFNPDAQPLDFDVLPGDQAVLAIETDHEHVVRVSGDENSDMGFNQWLFDRWPSLYHQLVRLNVIGELTEEEKGYRL